MGSYNFLISDSLQQNEGYKVWFYKEGFKDKSASAHPQTGQPLDIVMER